MSSRDNCIYPGILYLFGNDIKHFSLIIKINEFVGKILQFLDKLDCEFGHCKYFDNDSKFILAVLQEWLMYLCKFTNVTAQKFFNFNFNNC